MKSYHPFTVGKFKCYAVSDGTNTYHNPAALCFQWQTRNSSITPFNGIS